MTITIQSIYVAFTPIHPHCKATYQSKSNCLPHPFLIIEQTLSNYIKLLQSFYFVMNRSKLQVSQHSLLNIQQISSRTFNQDPSIMDTSIQHFAREHPHLANIMAKKQAYPTYEQIIKIQQQEIQRYKNALTAYINRIQDMQKGKPYNGSNETQIKQLMVMIKEREDEIEDLKQRYKNAIQGLQETVQKNEMLYREVEKYKKKNNELELNYSRDQNVFNKSQNLISNLSITKSNYEIELVNMKDSLVVLQKENKKIIETNEEYEEKLALLSQQIERLRGVNEFMKKENEKYRMNSKQQQEFIQRIQYENHQSKQAIERLRIENRDLKNNNSSFNQQLHQFHQKMAYKETLITDLQERQSRLSQTLKFKDSQIKQLQTKLSWSSQELERYDDQLKRKNTEYLQEIGRLRIALTEKSNSQKKIQVEKQQIIREYNELILRFESIKRQHSSIVDQKQNAIKELQELSLQKTDLIREIQMRLNERQKIGRENEILKESLVKSQVSFKLSNQERVKQYQATIKLFQQKERNLFKQFQLSLENLKQQKNSQINAHVNEINKLRADIASRDSQIAQFRYEITNKVTEIAQLKQSSMSQSTIIDNTRRDCEEKIRERTQIINQFKIKLQNYQKLIDQNRRERDMIFQEKNSLLLQLQKNQQHIQAKSSELSSYTQKIQMLSEQLKQLQSQYESSKSEIANYKRILGDNEKSLKQYYAKLKESDSRILELTNQLQRVTVVLKEKEIAILQLTAHNRQLSQIFQQKKGEVVSLRQINHKLTSNLSRTEESKGNFQMFMKEIQRLNQVVSSKQGEIKSQRSEIAKIIQKIDILYQEQLKVISIIENTYADDAKKNLQLNNQLTQLKDFILKLNKTTSGTLHDISKQSGTILTILNQKDSQSKNANLRLNDQLLQVQSIVSRKDQQIGMLRGEIQDLNIKLQLKQEQQTKQEEIFQKLIELTQENAAIKEQLNMGRSQHQMELSIKNQSIVELQSKINQIDKKQKKEIQELKAQINQKQLAYHQAIGHQRTQKQSILNSLAEVQTKLQQKQRQLEAIKSQKMRIQKNLDNLVMTISPRLSQLEKANELLAMNTKQIEKYKQLIQKFQSRSSNHNINIVQSTKISFLEKQVAKLQSILEIRNAQILSNEQDYFKLKTRFSQIQKQLLKQKAVSKQLKRSVETLSLQIKQIESVRQNSQPNLQSMTQLKYKNNQLHKQLQNLQYKLSQSQSKLQYANQQITSLQRELNKLLQINSKSINTISLLQSTQSEKRQLIEKIYNLQDELQETRGQLKQNQIQYDFMRSSQEQTKIHLHAYQYKTAQLQKEYVKLKEVLVNMNQEHSKLVTKNYFFQISLKNAQILQQKIQVLNAEINRLSSQNINLNQQVTSFKLALSGEYSLQNKVEEQLSLMFLLFVEVESLRNRLRQNEQQLQYSHNQQLYRYRT